MGGRHRATAAPGATEPAAPNLSVRTRRARRLRRGCVAVVVAGSALLGLSWAFANPPGAAPDEGAIYTKAMGTAFGQWRAIPLAPSHQSLSGVALFNHISFGYFLLPARYVPDPRWGCTRLRPRVAATCVDAPLSHGVGAGDVGVPSYVAFYPPAVVALLGLGARLAPNADDALYAGRLVSLLLCAGLLGVAFAVTRGRWVLVGLLAALSPMTLFLAATFNPSGVEISAGIAFAAVTVALASRTPSRLVWWAFLASGALLAVSRPVGFVWVVMDIALLAGLIGPRAFAHLFGDRPGILSRVALGGVALAAVSTVAWESAIGHSPHSSWSQAWHEIGKSAHQLQAIVNQFVGNFGWVDSPMPHVAMLLALSAYGALIVVALALAGWRGRLSLLAFAAVTIVVAFVLDAAAQLPFGFGVQARYVMPVAVALPILAGWFVDRRLAGGRHGRHRRAPRQPGVARDTPWSSLLAVVCMAGFGMLDFVGWLWNSHVSAVGARGTWSFIEHARWVPPGGWLPWVVLSVAGTLLLVAGMVTASLGPPTQA
jgi:hypothetical protein